MKILMVTPYLPYPLFSGGQVRSYNIIKELSKNNDITLFSVIRDEEEDKYIPELLKYCKNVQTFLRSKAYRIDQIVRAGFSPYPYIFLLYTLPKLREQIAQVLQKEAFDLIHVETFYLMHNLPQISVPIVLFEQNIEWDVYRRNAISQTSLLRPLLIFDAQKIKKWEERFWQKAQALIVMSDKDKKLVNRDAFVCGNGVDTSKFKVQSSKLKVTKEEKKVLFIGNFKWMENQDAARWILTDIWPAFIKACAGKPKATLWIVGKKIPGRLKRLTSDASVVFDENAPEDTAEIYRKSNVLLAPIRVGGGTSFKILEAMAAGVPVVTTPLGASSIGAGDRDEVLVSDSASELANNVLEILENDTLSTKLSQNARKFIEQKYDWKILVKQIGEIYSTVV